MTPPVGRCWSTPSPACPGPAGTVPSTGWSGRAGRTPRRSPRCTLSGTFRRTRRPSRSCGPMSRGPAAGRDSLLAGVHVHLNGLEDLVGLVVLDERHDLEVFQRHRPGAEAEVGALLLQFA